MPDVSELVRQAERLQGHVEALRAELGQLRKDLESLQAQGKLNGPGQAGVDCLAVALAHAQDLGPGFSSEHPDDLAARGDDWFPES